MKASVNGEEKPRPRVVVFDLDGTLFDSLPGVLRAIRHALEPFESRPLTMDIFPNLGGPPERFFPGLLRDPAHAPAALARLSSFVAENGWDASLYPGATGLLGDLVRAGFRTAVWTGRDRASTLELVQRHALGSLISAAVCGDDLATHKPDPEGMAVLLRGFAAAPGETLFVGDSDVDVRSGEAAGVRTILIRAGRTLDEDVAAKAWRVAESHAEAYALVRSWAGISP